MAHAVRLIDLADEAQVLRCFPVFRALRPHLDAPEFLRRVRAQAPEGYRIAAIEQDGQVVAAAGYRYGRFLAWGSVLYIDDLVTDPERKRQGLGGALLDWLEAQARERGCDEIHLDSGYARNDAHRLYLNKGYLLSSHHFARKL